MASSTQYRIEAMRVPRFYTAQTLASDSSVILEEDTSHHLLRVLRLRNGDPLILFNGDGNEYMSVVEEAGKKQATVQIRRVQQVARESKLRISLGQGISRGERMDFALQKAVELGVAAVTPLWTKRSQVQLSGSRLEKRLSHWQGVVRSACEQSGRVVLPALHDTSGLDSWCSGQANTALKLVLDPAASVSLKQLAPATEVCVLIGPEGGLDNEEIQRAADNGFQRIRLGPRILRTETAALATLSALQTLWGDLAD